MSVTSPFGLSVSFIFGIFQQIVRQALDGLNFHWVISDGAVNGIGRNGNILILPTPIPWSLSLLSPYDSDLRFLLGHKHSYDSDYDSKYDSVASENQP